VREKDTQRDCVRECVCARERESERERERARKSKKERERESDREQERERLRREIERGERRERAHLPFDLSDSNILFHLCLSPSRIRTTDQQCAPARTQCPRHRSFSIHGSP